MRHEYLGGRETLFYAGCGCLERFRVRVFCSKQLNHAINVNS